MVQKTEHIEFEDDIFKLSTDSDYMKIFTSEEISLEEIFKIRRWVRHSEREKGKFRKKLEAGAAEVLKNKKTVSERNGIAFWILNENENAKKELAESKTEISHSIYAQCLKQEEDVKSALAYLEGLPAGITNSTSISIVKLKMLYTLGRIAEGTKEVKQLLKSDPDSSEVMKLSALYAEETGDPQGAIDTYQALLEQEPGDPEAMFFMANLLDRFGFDKEALTFYEKAAEVFPTHVNAVLNLGQVYYEMGENEKASFCFKRVLKQRPEHRLALRFMKDVGATDNMYYDEKKAKKVEELNKILQIPVTDFELSVRSRNCLSRMNIRSLGDLIMKTEADLLSYKNFGETSLAEIKRMLASKNLYLGQAKDMQNQELKEKQKRRIIDVTNTELLQKSIDDLELSVRAGKCLKKMGVFTFGDLIKLGESVLLKMRNFGQTSLNEIKQKLASYGLALQND